MRDVITSSQLSLTPPRDDDLYGWDQDLDDLDDYYDEDYDNDIEFGWDEDFEIEWEYEQ